MTTATTATGLTAAYLDELGRRLHGPRGLRRDLLAEAADGLADATAARIAAGQPAVHAERAAVDDFGPVAKLAPDYQSLLARRQARRTALFAAVALPAITQGWSLTWDVATWPADTPAWTGLFSKVTDWVGMATAAACVVALVLLSLRRVRPEHIGSAIGTIVVVGMAVITVVSVSMTIRNIDEVVQLGSNVTGHLLLTATLLVLGWLPLSGIRARRAARVVAT